MKLLNKTSKYYAFAALVVFLIGSIAFYFALRTFVNNDIVEKLYDEKAAFKNQVIATGSIPKIIFSVGDDVNITKIDSVSFRYSTITKDTILYDEKEDHEEVPARLIQFYIKSKAENYRVIIIKSLVESDDLIEAIAIALSALIISFLVILYFINRKIAKVIWQPFYDSLDKIKKFDVTDTTKVNLSNSGITEFGELNKAVTLMTDKIQTDYENLKEFTENASHEIQTPLAIIKTQLELLIQADNFKDEQIRNIQSIYDATNRLSKLNQSLILLAKIENQQYGQKEQISFNELVKKYITHYNELISAKNLNLSCSLKDDVTLNINPSLADILINNLITNAIRHNIENGEINIELVSGRCTISNTGLPLQTDPMDLFERFKKDRPVSDSLGLGLSIVKKICEMAGIQINYCYTAPNHIIELRF